MTGPAEYIAWYYADALPQERRFRRGDWWRVVLCGQAVVLNVLLVGLGSIWWLSLGAAIFCSLCLRRVILYAIERRRFFREEIEATAAFARYLTLPDLRAAYLGSSDRTADRSARALARRGR